MQLHSCLQCLYLTVLVAALGAQPVSAGDGPESDMLSTRDSRVTANGEQAWGATIDSDYFDGESRLRNGWLYAGLPGFRVFGLNVFTALEADVLHRTMYGVDGARLNHAPMQRYGLFAGVTLMEREKHRGSLLAGSGIASDFEHLGRHSWYLHLIYDHRFTLSERFSFGLGVLVSCNLGQWKWPINLLPSLTWRVTPRTIVKVAWDNLLIEQWLWPRTAAFAEVRYDLSFFGIGRATRYEFETVSVGG
ncbi:MAG: hypothetical protein GF331_11580, partial [Chitinivibrionales bacterium]|nr:hypothetical protein [Chitinivibrionales bacterium]